jgi:polar amino acid transport system permease protein
MDFSGTLSRWPALLDGAALTLGLTISAMALGLLVGLVGSAASLSRARLPRVLVGVYVELIRNTPFLVQLYIIYFGLPALGLRLAPVPAAIVSMTIYVGAYLTETLRAGLSAIPRAQTEAAAALGLRPRTIWRHVVLPQALAGVYPALTSQFVLLLLTSSVVSAISAPELTGAANDIQGQTFRAFEAFLIAAAVYLALTSALRVALGVLQRRLFRFRVVGR